MAAHGRRCFTRERRTLATHSQAAGGGGGRECAAAGVAATETALVAVAAYLSLFFVHRKASTPLRFFPACFMRRWSY